MTLRPRVVETNPTWSGTATWTVTLRDTTGATASRSFTVTYTKDSKIVVNLPVPYIHQCYDTPEDFDGRWACGATSAVMILAYYKKLSSWPEQVKLPQPHTSNYGNYVCRRYTYGNYTFDEAAPQPNGKHAYGAYGYIHSPDGLARPGKVVDYFQKHGLAAQVDYTPTEQEIKAALDAGNPVWASTSLTSSGHIVVIKGYTSDGFYIVNDPFGSKPYADANWGDYDGADVKYSWSEMGIGGKWIVVSGLPISPGPVVDKSLSFAYEVGRFSLKVFNVDDMARVEVNSTQVTEVGYYQEKEVDLSSYLKTGENEILLTVRNDMYSWTYGFALYKDGQEIWRDQDGTVGVRGARNDDRTLGIVYRCKVKLTLGIPTPTLPSGIKKAVDLSAHQKDVPLESFQAMKNDGVELCIVQLWGGHHREEVLTLMLKPN